MIFIEAVNQNEDKFYFSNSHFDETGRAVDNQSRHMPFKTAIEYIKFLNSIGIQVNYSHVDTDFEQYVPSGRD